jgi:serine/threonine protein kinase
MICDETTSVLYEAIHRDSGERYAIKVPKSGNTQTRREAALLPTIRHSHIMPVRAVLETENGPALVLPFAEGGDLLGVLQEGPLPEYDAKRIFYGLLAATSFLHGQNVWHRDIKAENIMLMKSLDDPESALLADFGFARRFDCDVYDGPPWGSTHYLAPELYEGLPYTKAVDIWALGITLYGTLVGAFPFDPWDHERMAQEIMDGLPNLFQSDDIPYISEWGRDLVRAMLDWDPGYRITADEALGHPWFDAVRGEAEFAEGLGKFQSVARKEAELAKDPGHGQSEVG